MEFQPDLGSAQNHWICTVELACGYGASVRGGNTVKSGVRVGLSEC